jgi:hypothetical protein
MSLVRFRETAALLFCFVAASGAFAQSKIDFQRQVRPILSNHCFKCHGPDAETREAGLRLDERASATAKTESGAVAITPGAPDQSDLVKRIFSNDADHKMPPDSANRPLSIQQKDVLKTWIAQGAAFDGHWAFTPPKRSAAPDVKDLSRVRNAIDRFVEARLEAERMAPNAEASKTSLLRRVTLDLTGLPPTPEEIAAFEADNNPGAYERVVDRLLASPRFGERMALDWLDAARFADTNGYHIDNGRDMTRWREWVIEAFNQNKPIDRFIVEQLAGDLLPSPSLDQKIASGFNRNHMINFEGGAIPEEYHNAYIVDRVNTTSTVFLGITLGCAQCHDHKYDPFTQKDFYQLYAFFYNVPEKGLDGNTGNAAPFIRAPREDQAESLLVLGAQLAALKARWTEPNAELDAAQTTWEAEALTQPPTVHWQGAEIISAKSRGGATSRTQPDGKISFGGANPDQDVYSVTLKTDLKRLTGVQIEMFPDNRLNGKGPGRSVNGNVAFTNMTVAVSALETGEEPQPRKILGGKTAWHQENFPIEKVFDGDPQAGWALLPKTGEEHSLRFAIEPTTLEGDAALVEMNLHFESIFAGHHPARIRVTLTGDDQPLSDPTMPVEIDSLVRKAAAERSEAEKQKLTTYFRQNHLPQSAAWTAEVAAKEKEVTDFEAAIPTVMVMEEMNKPRDTFMLIRGAYDKKSEKVSANVPASLSPLPTDAPKNRLGLAEWLVARQQPLTSRVITNRVWQMFFGIGIVKTSEDFGSQGDLPSHPELLDYLATELTHPEGGVEPWDMKHLVRLIVTSAAYRRSSNVTKEQLARDPENRLLARGSRFRLTAEMIRDQALSAAGLLDDRIGGASVSPYQPPGIWEELASRADGKNWTAQEYTQSHGRDLYRRTMYTFWKRTAPPPSLMTFDAPDREICTVRRARTNTPLQALVLWNDPTYVEASRNLAQRVLKAEKTDIARLNMTFTLLVGRAPRENEQKVLLDSLAKQRAHFAAKPEKAKEVIQVGESPVIAGISEPELAAWTMVCSLIMNLDESLTRG